MKKITALFLLICIMLSLLPAAAAGEEYPFAVYFLDVGQGDCALVEANGHYMLIDGGAKEYSSTVFSFLKGHTRQLDYMVATHDDADHVGGLSGAVQACDRIGTILCENGRDYLERAEKKGMPIPEVRMPKAGETFMLGKARAQVLMPEEGAEKGANTSIVLRITYGAHSFLFTGDSEEADEANMLSSGAELKSTVLKVAHHGSSTSSGIDFIKAVQPRFAVISVGGDNDYHHPTLKTLSVLRTSGVYLYRTDLQGTVTCRSNGEELLFSTERNANADTYAYVGGYKNTINRALSTPAPETPAAATKKPKASRTPSPTLSPDWRAEKGQEYRYKVNTNTGKYHTKECPKGMEISQKNLALCTCSSEMLEKAGFSPCSICHPYRTNDP